MNNFQLLSAAREAARRGGDAAIAALRQGVAGRVVGKGKGGDFSIQGDVDSEKNIIESLVTSIGELKVVTEEAGERIYGENPEYTAIIDPIDGSRNYKRGLPFFSVSIAIARGETLEDVIAAVVYAPLLGMEFSAIKGQGAFLNNAPIRVTTHETVEGGLIFVGASPKAVFLPQLYILHLVSKGGIVRSLGSASLELAFVASGGADGYIDYWGTMRVIDIAAAFLIAREAGAWVKLKGIIKDKAELSLKERLFILASATPKLAAELEEIYHETLGLKPEDLFPVSLPHETQG
ncbi:MAG: inositol monophosphatase [Infirmifilum sp.]